MTTLIFSNSSYWENDFIINELFPENTRILFANPVTFIDPNYYIENKVEIGNCCLLFSTNEIDFTGISKISTILKPFIILQMSDEDGRREEYIRLASFTKLLVRQYHFKHYDYGKYNNNILYIPLGYKSTNNNYFITNQKKIEKLSTERKYDWSFIGDSNKHDRSAILHQLCVSKLNRYCMGNNISSIQMMDIYSDSIFVPNCRGNVTIDCFRTYEASACGAIPVVVGDICEMMETYSKENYPPWIFETNWKDAIHRCCCLVNNPELLLQYQRNNISWWKNRVNHCKTRILQNLIKDGNPPMNSPYKNKKRNENKIQIVIARYKENLDWTQKLSNVFICNKGLPLKENMYGHQIINDLENVGREGHTIYSYIYDNYDNLSDYTIFLQGNPFDHCPEILNKLMGLNCMESPPDFEFLAVYISDIFLGYNIYYIDLKCYLNFIKAYKDIFHQNPSDEMISNRFPFGSGAQFIVSKSNILSRSRDFYKRIIDMLSYNSDPIEGHIIERFHKIILSSDENIYKSDCDPILGTNFLL